jgi:hypothetical protein
MPIQRFRRAASAVGFTFSNYFVRLALQGKDITVWGEGEQLRGVLSSTTRFQRW